MAFSIALIARPPLTHRHSGTAARFDVHMMVPLSVPQPLITGVIIVAQNHAEHLSSPLLDFRAGILRESGEYPRKPLGRALGRCYLNL